MTGINFIQAWDTVQESVHGNAKAKGFWEGDRNDGEAIALMHSELSEALEALREGNPPSKKAEGFTSLEEELADVVIRIMDFAGGNNLHLAEAILTKMTYNATRPHKHGKEF